jgi:hypothetical protein
LLRYPLTAFGIQYITGYVVDRPISLEQPVYLPGNEHQGVWSSPMLETVLGPEPKCEWPTAKSQASGVSLLGDLELVILVFDELRRSYTELPGRLLCDLVSPVSWLFSNRLPPIQAATEVRFAPWAKAQITASP